MLERLEEKKLVRDDQEFGCGHVKFEMPIRHASGDVENSVKFMSLKFKEEVQRRK